MNYLTNFCSLCLQCDTNVTSQYSINANAREIMEYVVPKSVLQKSEIPIQVCDFCLTNMNNFSKFKNFCLENITSFSEYVQILIKEYGYHKYLSVPINEIPYFPEDEVFRENHENLENAEEPICETIKSEIVEYVEQNSPPTLSQDEHNKCLEQFLIKVENSVIDSNVINENNEEEMIEDDSSCFENVENSEEPICDTIESEINEEVEQNSSLPQSQDGHNKCLEQFLIKVENSVDDLNVKKEINEEVMIEDDLSFSKNDIQDNPNANDSSQECDDLEMELDATIKNDKMELLEKLQEWNLVKRSLPCKRCGADLKLRQDNSSIDGLRWRCTARIKKKKKRYCEYSQSFRSGTIFAKSRLPITKILAFVDLWLENTSLLSITEELELSGHTCVDWAAFCREIILVYFLNNPTKLGGPGKVVEIEESRFGKQKYLRGRQVAGQRVFGAYERGSGRICIVSVDYCGVDTLIPVIENWIEPGTTIITDCCLGRRAYNNLKVNHLINFVNKDSEASGGRNGALLPGNLARYIFYKKCTDLDLDRSIEFYRMAGEVCDASQSIPAEFQED